MSTGKLSKVRVSRTIYLTSSYDVSEWAGTEEEILSYIESDKEFLARELRNVNIPDATFSKITVKEWT